MSSCALVYVVYTSCIQGRRKLPGVGLLIDQNDDAAEGSEIEVRSVHHSARTAGKNFPPSFSDIRMGSRGTFVLWRLGSVTFKLFATINLQLCQLWPLPLKRSLHHRRLPKSRCGKRKPRQGGWCALLPIAGTGSRDEHITITQEYKGRRELTQSSNPTARRWC